MANDKLIPIPIEDEMRQAYLDYAMSVIVSRALPDVRDGLKPVHRRILYSMYDTGVTPEGKTRKCAKIVGDVMGRFHPHGDMAIYDAMVRMAQDFSLRYPLVIPQGNFGSVDGDPAAASRYTEAKLARMGMELLADIDKNTVTWRPTYDNSEEEPEVLPSGIPNLLVNGSAGIAVGMATNIPPHNLSEVVDACVAVIDDPNLPAEALLNIVKAPDFPTRGLIMGLDGARQAYLTGRGSVVMRARSTIEEIRKDRMAIIVTEIPYQVNKARLIEKVAELVRDKRISGVSDIRDESDRNGMRIVIELMNNARPQVVLNQLYKHTDLQSNFSVNMLALVDGSPQTLSLKECITYYLEHRKTVIEKRTRFDLDKAQARAHIVEGLQKALDHLDAIIATIRAAATTEDARTNLMTGFALSELQANAILDMRLQRLTGLARQELNDEYAELIRKIGHLEDILSSERRIYAVVREELLDIKKRFGDPRRSEIVGEAGSFNIEDLIPESDVVVTISRAGYIKRQATTTYRSQRRGGKGITGTGLKDEDFLEHVFVTTTHHHLLFFTNRAKVYRLKVHEIPEAGRQAKGTAVINLLDINQGEHIAAVIPVRDFGTRPGVDEFEEDVVETEDETEVASEVDDLEAEEEVSGESDADEDESSRLQEGVSYLVMVTSKGLVKKTPLYEYGRIRASGLNALVLREGDSLIGVKVTPGNEDLVLISKRGWAIRFPEQKVPTKGRVTQGVKGMRLRTGDQVVAFEHITRGEVLQIITKLGYGKRIPLERKTLSEGTEGAEETSVIRITGRAVMGVRAIKLRPDDEVVAAGVIKDEDQIIFSTATGSLIRMNASDISEQGRLAQGVIIVRMDEGDEVTAMAVVAADEEDEVEDDPLA